MATGGCRAKRLMQPLALKTALKTTKIDRSPWKQELQHFLLQYRTTPHCSTGVPAAELLLTRQCKDNHQNAENRNANEDANREEPHLRRSERVRSRPYSL